jgi:hypothetical protein
MDEGRRILSRVARRRGRSMDKGGPFQWMPSSRSHRRCSAMDRASEPERAPAGGDQDPHHVAMLVPARRHDAHAHAEGAPADAHGSPMRAPRQRARSMSQQS